MSMDPTLYIIISTLMILLSGLSGVLISHHLTQRSTQRSAKRDVLARFVGNRFALADPTLQARTNGEPFVSLNEVCVIYANDKDVIAAVRKMHEEIADSERLNDNIVTLIKCMAEAADVPMKDALNDRFFTNPFTPKGSRPILDMTIQDYVANLPAEPK